MLALLGLLAMHATPGMLPGAGQMSTMSSERLAPPMTVTTGDTLEAETPASDEHTSVDQPRLPPRPGQHHMTRPCVSESVRHLPVTAPHGTGLNDALANAFQAADVGRVSTAPARGQPPGPDLTRLCISRT
jgi:hypothetical protein